jgi:hypothetical protein
MEEAGLGVSVVAAIFFCCEILQLRLHWIRSSIPISRTRCNYAMSFGVSSSTSSTVEVMGPEEFGLALNILLPFLFVDHGPSHISSHFH